MGLIPLVYNIFRDRANARILRERKRQEQIDFPQADFLMEQAKTRLEDESPEEFVNRSNRQLDEAIQLRLGRKPDKDTAERYKWLHGVLVGQGMPKSASSAQPATQPTTSTPETSEPNIGIGGASELGDTDVPSTPSAPTLPGPPPGAAQVSARASAQPAAPAMTPAAPVRQYPFNIPRRPSEVASEKSKQEAEAAGLKAKALVPAQTELETERRKSRMIPLLSSLAREGYEPVLDAEGEPTGIKKIERPKLSETAAAKVAGTEATTAQTVATTSLREAQTELTDAQTAYTKAKESVERSKLDPNSPVYKAKAAAAASAQSRLALAWANYRAMNFGTDQQGNALPGSLQLPSGQPVGRGFQTNVRPTAPTRQMAETAATLEPKFDAVIAQLDDPKFLQKLGPAQGRWNEFMAGTWGAGDPDFADLRTTIGMLQTGAMRAHVGARGGGQMLDKFTGLINSNHMDVPTLKASLSSLRKFISGYSDYVFGPGGPMQSMDRRQPSVGGPPGAAKQFSVTVKGKTFYFPTQKAADDFKAAAQK